jgi:hypothetical protein
VSKEILMLKNKKTLKNNWNPVITQGRRIIIPEGPL